jgi:predicted permease
MPSLFQDIRFALRSCSRSPGFTTVAVLAFAIGIGANTAIFTVVHAVLFQRLPIADSDRVVMVWEETSRRPGRPNTVGPANLVRWVERATSFDQIAGYFEGRTNLTGTGAPEELATQIVTPNFFATLGTPAFLGRTFALGEDGDVAVLSYSLWQRRFGSDRSLVSRSIQLNGRSTQIIGVMPHGAGVFLRDMTMVGRPVDLWTPFLLGPQYREWQGRYMAAVARLRPGISHTAAQTEMRTIATEIEKELPRNDTGWSVLLVPIRDAIAGSVRLSLLVLSGAVGFVLLMACANVANLLLARGAARQREIGIRRALGASRARIASQLLTESLVLAILGGTAGLLVAEWGIDALAAMSPIDLNSAGPLGLNSTVLVFTSATSILTALVSGAAFAIEGSTADVLDTLTEGTRQVGATLRQRRVRHAFVVAEIALAVVLLFGAGLMLRSFANIRGVNPGFESANVLTARVNLPLQKYSTSPLRLGFFRDATERLRALPGVEAAGAISFLPLAGPGAGTSFAVVGQPPPAAGQAPLLDVRVCDNGYFDTMRVPLVRGLFSTFASCTRTRTSRSSTRRSRDSIFRPSIRSDRESRSLWACLRSSPARSSASSETSGTWTWRRRRGRWPTGRTLSWIIPP